MNLLDANDRPGRYPNGWYAETADLLPPFPPLQGSVDTDVCIVGGGYTGLSTAWHLARAGVSVVLVEAQRVGFGASGRNGGQVGTGHRLDQVTLAARHGKAAAHALWDIAEEAKGLVRDVARTVGAHWQDGVVHVVRRQQAADAERRQAETLALEYGYDRIEPLDRAAVTALVGSEAFAGGSVDWGAGHVHPLRLAVGIAALARDSGARLHEATRAHQISGTTVCTNAGKVSARHVVVAANGYLGSLVPEIAARVMPINNFVAATEPLGAAMPLARPVAVADDLFVVNYWRPTVDGRLLFGGGESYGYRFPRDIARLVRARLAAIYPDLSEAPLASAWGGTLAITRSRMPYFAELRPNVWSAGGYSGHGVSMALMAGRLIAEAIRGDRQRFDQMAALPNLPFPGGGHARSVLLALAMSWFALRDRAGI